MKAGAAVLRAFNRLVGAGAALAGVLMVAIMLLVCVKVLLRYSFGRGIIGADQASGIMLLFMTFLAAAWVLRREEHVVIDILYARLPERVQRWLAVINSSVCAMVCGVIVVFGSLEVVSSWRRGIRVAAEVELPRSIILFIIPVGCLLLVIQFTRRAAQAARTGLPPQRVGG